MNIGANIARIRRECNLTQEQLGRKLNISAQAVSKWENGGTPDAELLPAIADALHVTIDTLFGRENVKNVDMRELFTAWYLRLPQEKQKDELFRLMLVLFENPVSFIWDSSQKETIVNLPLKSCNGKYNTATVLLRSELLDDHGMLLAIPAEDFPLFLILPESKEGYRAGLLSNERYRKLFSALALPASMELLFFLNSNEVKYYSLEALEKACKIDKAVLLPALDALGELNLIIRRSIVETDGERNVYVLNEDPSFIPFLIFARWFVECPGHIVQWSSREKPLLDKEEDKNGEDR